MREIKFRAWDKQENCWYEPTYEAYNGHLHDLMLGLSGDLFVHSVDGMSHESTFPGRYELMQFTGLKDKTGKEIYEGDIVSMFGGTQYSQVFWNNEYGHWAIILQSSGASPVAEDLLGNHLITCEVAGNKFENPELLEEE